MGMGEGGFQDGDLFLKSWTIWASDSVGSANNPSRNVEVQVVVSLSTRSSPVFKIVYGELAGLKTGRPKDVCKREAKALAIDTQSLESLVADRTSVERHSAPTTSNRGTDTSGSCSRQNSSQKTALQHRADKIYRLDHCRQPPSHIGLLHIHKRRYPTRADLSMQQEARSTQPNRLLQHYPVHCYRCNIVGIAKRQAHARVYKNGGKLSAKIIGVYKYWKRKAFTVRKRLKV
jgi:hypothetical protein